MRRCLVTWGIGLSLLALSIAACVHRDLAEQTLVTVDVSGTWRLRQQ